MADQQSDLLSHVIQLAGAVSEIGVKVGRIERHSERNTAILNSVEEKVSKIPELEDRITKLEASNTELEKIRHRVKGGTIAISALLALLGTLLTTATALGWFSR